MEREKKIGLDCSRKYGHNTKSSSSEANKLFVFALIEATQLIFLLPRSMHTNSREDIRS